MFGIGRRKTHRELAKSELSESFDHFMQAATHAAGGVGKTVGPRVHIARQYVTPAAGRIREGAATGWGTTMTALTPLAVAATDGARQAGSMARRTRAKNMKRLRRSESRMSGSRWPMLAGLLLAGAAVGTVGAIAMRRRQQQQWDEYDPSRPLDDADALIDNALRDSAGRPAPDRSMGKAGDTMPAKPGGDTMPSKPSGDTMSPKPTPGMMPAKAKAATDNAKPGANKADGVMSSTPTRNTPN